MGGQLCVFGGVSAGVGGWVWCVLMLNTVPAVALSLVLQHNSGKSVGSLPFALRKVFPPLCFAPWHLPPGSLLSCNLVFISSAL